jgi:hypothetical protein
MADNRADRLRAVYAQLEALAEDLPPIAFDHDAEAYNRLVDELIDLGYAAHPFRIADEDLFRPVGSTNSVTGEIRYRDSIQVHYHVLDRKVKSLLKFLRLTTEAVMVDVDLPRTSPDER